MVAVGGATGPVLVRGYGGGERGADLGNFKEVFYMKSR